MKIDKALFLALATSLSAVACTATADEDETGNAQGAASGADAYCWDPAVESVGTPAAAFFSSEIGFDPVKDYPAAESFCGNLAYAQVQPAAGDTVMEAERTSLYYKCEQYAKQYVPYTTYLAFMELKEKAWAKSTPAQKWGVIYAVDKEIVARSSVCKTNAAKATCRPTGGKKDCEIVAAQLKTEWQGALHFCQTQDPGFSVHSCVEGGLAKIGPHSADGE